MDAEAMDTPLSEKTITMELSLILRRCSELIDNPDDLSDLSLEEPRAAEQANDPYNRTSD